MAVTFTKRGIPVTNEEIAHLEKQLNQELPREYKDFLRMYNGGKPVANKFPIPGLGDGGVTLFVGIDESEDGLVVISNRMKNRIPPNCLPIAEAEGGNWLCLSLRPQDYGVVYFWDHEKEVAEDENPTCDNLYKVAESFADFWNIMTPFDPVAVPEVQIKSVWVNPDFLKKVQDNESKPTGET